MRKRLCRGIIFSSLASAVFAAVLFAPGNPARAATESQTGTSGGNDQSGQSASLTLTNSGDPTNSVTTVGGGGGDSDSGGGPDAGGSATSIDTENYAGTGNLDDQVSATGGGGGWSDYDTGGQGGSATATENGVSSVGAVMATSTAIGGAGGHAMDIGTGGNGGAATSSATGQSTASGDAVSVTSTATGGNGGTCQTFGNYGVGGSAEATAIGSGSGQTISTANATAGSSLNAGAVEGNAEALGASGSATATASVSNLGSYSLDGNDISGNEAISSTASGPTQGKNTSVVAWADEQTPSNPQNPNPPAQANLSQYQAVVINYGVPGIDNSTLASDPLVNRDFDLTYSSKVPGPTSFVLGLITLGGGSDGDGLQHTWTTSTTVDFGSSGLDGQHLILGLLNPTSTGDGFDSLTFTMMENTSTLLQQETFTSLAEANAYFTDDPIDLGAISDLQSVEFSMSVTTTNPGDSYYASLIYGQATVNSNYVPEPTCGALLLLGGSTLFARRRRRARRV